VKEKGAGPMGLARGSIFADNSLGGVFWFVVSDLCFKLNTHSLLRDALPQFD